MIHPSFYLERSMKKLVLLLSSLMFISAMASEGVVSTQKSDGIIHVKITGTAAADIMKSMTKAPHGSKKQGSLFTTFILGKNINCSESAEVRKVSICRFSMNEDGLLNMTTSSVGTNTSGKAEVIKSKNGINLQITGAAGTTLLNGMKNVSENGTMTINKDSGDIKCSQVKEFGKNDAGCSLILDAFGSASTK
jgi:hypothetical protein